MKTKFNSQLTEEQFETAVLTLLSEILETLKRSPGHDSQYYDSADVKRLLNISDSTLHRIRKSQNIPHLRIGRKIFYPKSFFNNAFKK
ncbi:helix-turn-helix domain-containing protein [Chryseobacterium sp. PBS4-4]|uniref:Helix-turn-helix domain-containing protein n=1 Tax=Chryseobacterium edaphi TaxID=2976532 RepID=A0ABT2W3R0_9FLAO|nr:helix-turn-helix domain-containing protein [Chryseobacterium edaphi]MCU7616858.1 helix-turn-helix domain-containing protein [Chryseobacterium edaphi]